MRVLNLAVLADKHFEELRRWRDSQRSILRTQNDMEPSEYRKTLIDDECKRYSNENHLYGIEDWSGFIAFGGLTHIKWGLDHAISAELSFISKDPINYEKAFMFHLRVSSEIWFSNSYYRGEVLISESYPMRTYHIKMLERYGFKMKSLIHNLTRENYIG